MQETLRMIYLATPYTHRRPEIQTARVEACIRAVDHFLKKGVYLYAPVVTPEAVSKLGHTVDWDEWMNYAIMTIQRFDRFMIFELPGHEASRGLAWERDYIAKNKYEVQTLAWKDAQPFLPPALQEILLSA